MQKRWSESPFIQGRVMYRFQQRLKFIKHNIKEWNKQDFGDIFMDKRALENQMEQIQWNIISRGGTTQLKEKEGTLRHQLQEILARE